MRFSLGKENVDPVPIEPLKIMHNEKNIQEVLLKKLQSMLSEVPAEKPIVLVCVGTDRSTGDALGPLVGSRLSKLGALKGLYLYGTLGHPVHAMNLNETLSSIYQHFDEPFIIAVDACLGQLTSVGCIQVGYGPVKPGAGVNKDLPPVGNIHVTGIVNVGGFMEYFVLQNTRLSLVMNMAEVISTALHHTMLNVRASSPISFARLEQ
ncbi:spore protease YyaC [Paenibacillus thalictri]|uniref:Spore protease YyaC n=1 Tax=Paenibacillus thalictri TaxID=2527873 RepID=A0A4Q9DNC4_9BACL|nr:spore protease YyaC [Paenibacillus thalictri]TBL77458.1 spore protease YyaC [Paenibacillus thalictri]